MKNLIKCNILFICLFLIVVSSCNSREYNYKIKNYKLTLEPSDNGLDVYSTIDLIYEVHNSGEKSDGFKFVGNSTVDSLVCWDENGEINCKIDYLKETKLSWYFPALSRGIKMVKVKFILKNYIGSDNILYVPWAGVFRVPVDNATYNVILKNDSVTEFIKPSSWQYKKQDGLIKYSYNQSPLQQKIIELQLEK